MKVIIEDAFPDGLTVRFAEEFFLNTWEEVVAFIDTVEKASNWGSVKLKVEVRKKHFWSRR